MLDLTLTNRVLSADEAEAWGLVNRVVPDDEVDSAAAELAQQFASGPAWALGHAKHRDLRRLRVSRWSRPASSRA